MVNNYFLSSDTFFFPFFFGNMLSEFFNSAFVKASGYHIIEKMFAVACLRIQLFNLNDKALIDRKLVK